MEEHGQEGLALLVRLRARSAQRVVVVEKDAPVVGLATHHADRTFASDFYLNERFAFGQPGVRQTGVEFPAPENERGGGGREHPAEARTGGKQRGHVAASDEGHAPPQPEAGREPALREFGAAPSAEAIDGEEHAGIHAGRGCAAEEQRKDERRGQQDERAGRQPEPHGVPRVAGERLLKRDVEKPAALDDEHQRLSGARDGGEREAHGERVVSQSRCERHEERAAAKRGEDEREDEAAGKVRADEELRELMVHDDLGGEDEKAGRKGERGRGGVGARAGGERVGHSFRREAKGDGGDDEIERERNDAGTREAERGQRPPEHQGQSGEPAEGVRGIERDAALRTRGADHPRDDHAHREGRRRDEQQRQEPREHGGQRGRGLQRQRPSAAEDHRQRQPGDDDLGERDAAPGPRSFPPRGEPRPGGEPEKKRGDHARERAGIRAENVHHPPYPEELMRQARRAAQCGEEVGHRWAENYGHA